MFHRAHFPTTLIYQSNHLLDMYYVPTYIYYIQQWKKKIFQKEKQFFKIHH